jgi:hypothetical protein
MSFKSRHKLTVTFEEMTEKFMTWLKRTVDVLYTLSTNGVLGEGIGLVCAYTTRSSGMHRLIHFPSAFPTGKSNFCWTCYSSRRMCPTCGLRQAIKDISPSYDALVDLFKSFESFLRRLDIYTKIPSITEIIVKIPI